MCGSVLTCLSVMLPILDRWGDGQDRERRDGARSPFASKERSSPLLFLCCPRTSAFASLTTSNPDGYRDMCGCSRFQNQLGSERGAPPAHTEILLPLGGTHLFSSQPSFSLLSKEKEAKRKDSPAGLCLEFQITNGKTQKENHVFHRKRPLHAPDGLDGSGFRAFTI
jgi:hypothetical protein